MTLPEWQAISPKGALKMALHHDTWSRALRRGGDILQVRDELFLHVAVFVRWELLAARFPQPHKDASAFFGTVARTSIANSRNALRQTKLSMPVLVFNTNNLSPTGAVVPAGLLVPRKHWEQLRGALT